MTDVRTRIPQPYVSTASNAHVLSHDALMVRLIARCRSGFFRRLRHGNEKPL